jgi:hypothetical protein
MLNMAMLAETAATPAGMLHGAPVNVTFRGVPCRSDDVRESHRRHGPVAQERACVLLGVCSSSNQKHRENKSYRVIRDKRTSSLICAEDFATASGGSQPPLFNA